MTLFDISSDHASSFKRSLISGQYTLLLGSGISTDSTNSRGQLPSAEELRLALCNFKGVSTNAPLQQIFSLLDQHEVKEHVTKYYVNCSPGPSLTRFPAFIWRRAFTFNIDDALEAVYSRSGSLQSLATYHFEDAYEDAGTLDTLPLVHLHGYVQQEDRGYVFSRNQYVKQINEHNPWMTVLAQIVSSEPVIVIGSSLDEVDLDYYLSFRTSTSGRADEGPSIFVSPNSDALTKHHCEKLGMLQFVGTCEDFFSFCHNFVPERPTPVELIPRASQNLLPSGIGERDALSFWSDFELVPGAVNALTDSSKFLYGHPPSWVDLAADLDIARNVSSHIIEAVQKKLHNLDDPTRLVILFEIAGTGKTTILNRCAFETAKQGFTTFRCTALSRLEPANTARILNTISGPLVIVVDNFADQVTSFQGILDIITKRDVVVLAGERSSRRKYITQALSGIEFQSFVRSTLEKSEVFKLLDTFIKFGLIGDKRAITEQTKFADEVYKDPIAIACCRILNDLRPLDRIVTSMVEESNAIEMKRYLMAALARHCFSGGVRYSVVASAYQTENLNAQFQRSHPLPLAFINEHGGGGFVVPQNATLSTRMLEIVGLDKPDELLNAFIDLGNAIAPRVNRRTISQRTAEARLAGRLFDFDDVVEPFLTDKAYTFYEMTQGSWQWNSRYWEQVSQLHLSEYHKAPETAGGEEALDRAVQHARHAVSIESHPFPLTTLAQTLIAYMTLGGEVNVAAYEEAFEKLSLAIELERRRARMAVQPFVTLFRGSRVFLENGGQLSGERRENVERLVREAREQFPRDREVNDLGNALIRTLNDVRRH